VSTRSDMTAAGLRLLDLLTVSEAAAVLTGRLGVRYSAERVARLADEGELERVRLGMLVRITAASVTAYVERVAS